MNIRFDSASTDDVPELVAMMRDFYAIDAYPMNEKTSAGLLQDFISNEQHNGGVWLIKADDQNAGYLILTTIFSFEYGGWIGFVDELFVTKDLRGQGIGRKAVDFIIGQARKTNLKLLYLEVEPHNENAQKLYLAAGFKKHKRSLLAWKPTLT